ncbi:DinB superfamily protein [Chitinophaga costaii]|uniref:DinB superfamily protein n=1 Tax=Chitinophaga costaii TaxID=1335309 RepID=A0A1C4FNL3_9BACT|nr:DinB family protein [Chitinophaga costaii]PUZ29912.1 DinB family protein [Chitinophaga costaii]SCC57456.1 DinB superfamily protein [Chitinophaga costaii]
MTNTTTTANNRITVNTLREMLEGRHAHATLEDVVSNLPVHLRGVVPNDLPYSLWQLLEHIRITQWDILAFSQDPQHVSPPWPEGYWPKEPAPPDAQAWDRTVKAIEKDRTAFVKLLEAKDADLYEPFPHGDGQNLLREAILIIDHTSYHLGEMLVLRRLLGAWEKS